ncbi:MAG: tetratricopeptide repeat protein [Acidobacteriota bacterium]
MSSAASEAGAAVAAIKTLLVLDLVDSTRLVSDLGDREASRVIAELDRIARDLLVQHEGLEIDKTDGFLLLFERPVQAVSYACSFHEALADLASRLEVPLAARAGIHLGEVFLRENTAEDVALGAKPLEVEGLAKLIAARVMSLAEGGQTLMTRGAFDLSRRSAVGGPLQPRLRWHAHGPYLFKGVSEPLEVFEAGIEGQAPLVAPSGATKAQRAVVAGDEITLGWRPAVGHSVPRLPHWLLDKKLGEGGFGEVWLGRHEKTREPRVFKFCHRADRLRGLKREVTLFRLLKGALGDRDDITRVVDWNFDEAPFYLESEYTEGGDLMDWAERQGGLPSVPLETRLELVAQVAEALGAAHSVGILHKDIKPANVLVRQQPDGRPKIRLTDFGIGLVADPTLLASQGITMLGMTELTGSWEASETGTRLYMAPELIEGRDASVQADIYALGVMLYQMVLGDFSRTLAPGWKRQLDDEILIEDIAHFVDGMPEKRPRSALEVAERLRSLETRRRDRQARALELEREAAAHEALEKARRRRRVLAALVAFLSLFAAVLVVALQRVSRAATEAREQAEIARRTSEFLVELFNRADPTQAQGEEMTVREILDQGAARIDDDLVDLPVVQATLMHTMGSVYKGLAVPGSAVPLLYRAVELRRQLYGTAHAEVAQSLFMLGEVLRIDGDYESAEPAYREALAIRLDLLGETDPDVAESLRGLGNLMLEAGRYPEALEAYGECLAIEQRLFGDEYPKTAHTLNGMGVVMYYLGRDEEAEANLRRALELARRLWGAEHPDVVYVLSTLGFVLTGSGQPGTAEPILEEAVEVWRKLLGESHPNVAIVLTRRADALLSLGRYRDAEELLKQALAIPGASRAPRGVFWRTAEAQAYLAVSRAMQGGRFDEAEASVVNGFEVLVDRRGLSPARNLLHHIITFYDAWGKPERVAHYRAKLRESMGQSPIDVAP